MAIVNADSGKVIAIPDIGDGCDATAFDVDQKLAFASAGDGTITVIREDTPDKFIVAETVQTQDHARTMALDPKTHELFTVTAKVLPERKVEPDTFSVGGREVEISLRLEKRVKRHRQERPFHTTYARIESSSFLRDQFSAAWTKAITSGCGFLAVDESWG